MTSTLTLPFPAFYYPTFGGGAGPLTYMGVATTVGNALQLVPGGAANTPGGAAWNGRAQHPGADRVGDGMT